MWAVWAMCQPASIVLPRQLHLCHEGAAVFKAAKQTLIPALMQAQAVPLTLNKSRLLKQLISESESRQINSTAKGILKVSVRCKCIKIGFQLCLKSTLWLRQARSPGFPVHFPPCSQAAGPRHTLGRLNIVFEWYERQTGSSQPVCLLCYGLSSQEEAACSWEYTQ